MYNRTSELIDLSIEQIQFLEEELIVYSNNPEEGSCWEEVKANILKKY